MQVAVAGFVEHNSTTLMVVVGGLTAAGWLGRKVWHGMKSAVAASEFVQELRRLVLGTPASDTAEAVPGLNARLAIVEHEVQTNSGGSLKDLAIQNGVKADAAAALAADVKKALDKAQRLAQDDRLATIRLLREFMSDRTVRELAYVRALAHLGIDLTEVTEHLEPWDGLERRAREQPFDGPDRRDR